MKNARLRAAIDVGTNSVRWLAADFSHTPPRAVARGLAITRLGEGLDETGRIGEAALARTAEAVAEFARAAKAAGVAMPRLFGTQALREAGNGRAAADRIAEAAGAPLAILSGEEEADLARRGVLLGHPEAAGGLILDVGGGSTEFIPADGGKARSLKLGSVRHTERFLRGDPPGTSEVAALRTETERLAAEGLAGWEDRAQFSLWAVAGTATQLAALDLALDPYDPERADGLFLSRERIHSWFDRLASLSRVERAALAGMHPGRVDTIVAGCAILLGAVRASGAEGLRVSEYDGLWGALVTGAMPPAEASPAR